MSIMSKLQASYLAGLLDGEGYISLLRSKRGNKKHWSSSREYIYIPVIKIAMTDREIIEHLKDSYGGYMETRKAHGNSRESYCWTARKNTVMRILEAVYPYLRVKKNNARLLLEYKNLNNGAGRPIDDDNWSKRDDIYDQLRELNRTGAA